jgi:AraC family transcriptional activator of pobA
VNNAVLNNSDMSYYAGSPNLLDDGCIVLCRSGRAELQVNFHHYMLEKDNIITLFPGDVVQMHCASSDFNCEVLAYNASMLREASLHFEHSVYSSLRSNRFTDNRELIEKVVKSMFSMIRYFITESGYEGKNAIILLLLKSFFMGYDEYLKNNPQGIPEQEGSQRTNQIFNKFMEILERNYKQSRDVAYYAGQLFITRKYLGMIVQRKTRHTTKQIIDEYVIMQLKLTLRTSQASLKQIAAEYNFSDASFFTRYFRHSAGIKPIDYRKKYTI